MPETSMLSVDPRAATAVRSLYTLDSPDRLHEALKLLKEWIEMQPHFKKKDFSDEYLEKRLLASKGSVERTKTRLDKYCTIRTLMPRFFDVNNVREFSEMLKCFKTVMCSEYADDYYRVMIVKPGELEKISERMILDFYKFAIIAAEYMIHYDYFNGAILILDYLDINIAKILSNINLVDLNQALTILVEGLGIRIKGIHVMSKSKLLDAFINLIKHAFSKKLFDRVYAHNSVESLLEYVPLDILPSNYGGKEKSIDNLLEICIREMSEEKVIDHLNSMKEACTDEKYRSSEKFNEDYLGMPGSFRTLSVD